MKALFLNPYIHDFTAYDLWLRPLGLYYLAAVVRRHSDVEIHWLDALDRFQPGMSAGGRADGRGKYRREPVARPDVYQRVPRSYSRYGMALELFQQRLAALPEIDLILVTSLMTYWLPGLQFTLATVRQRFPRAKVAVGGVLPTLAPAATRALLAADHVVSGYGEVAVLELVKGMGARVTAVPAFAAAGEIPLPAVDLGGSQSHLPLLTARGCPLDCSYCASRLLNPHFLERRPDDILAEIEAHQQAFATRHFILFDDALLVNKQIRFLPVFSRLAAAAESGVRFHTPNGLHAREIDDRVAAVMHAAGFVTVRLGFESLSPRILRRSSHKVGRVQMENAVRNLERAGYRRGQIGAYLLFGYPGQSLAEMEEALDFISALGVVPHLAVYSPVPGTRDFREWQQQGVLATPLDPLQSNKTYFLYEKSGFSAEEIQRLNEKATAIATANAIASDADPA